MSLPPTRVVCPHCSYEIVTYTEALEALEGGARCLLCGGELDRGELERAVDGWKDEALLEEGAVRADDGGAEVEEDSLFEGVPDFGDEGEDEEDPLL